mgnify:CR=1 FL=1
MPRYDDLIKEEARALYLQGLGYKTIANKIREHYNNSIAHNTVKSWAKQGDWQSLLDKQREVIKQETASNSTRSTIKNIKTLQAIQSKFITQLKTSSSEIRPYEMVSVIRELQRLEGVKDLRDALIREIAEKLPEAMIKAKIPQKQINLVKTTTIISDIVYKPKETVFLQQFRDNMKIYGISMLIEQAIPSFYQWFGFSPKVDNTLLKKINKKI